MKDADQEGDAPKTTDRSGYYNEDDLHVWKDRYLRRNEDPSRRDAKTGGMSSPKEMTFKYRRISLSEQILDPRSQKTRSRPR